MEEKQNKPRKDFKGKGKFGGKKFAGKKFGGRGKSFGKDKPDFKKRKLAPGVEFVDRELGVGIVRKLTDEGIVVAFGDAEKLIPRKKREDGFKKDGFKKDGHRKDFKREAFRAAKPMEKKVFTFDTPLPAAKRLVSKREKRLSVWRSRMRRSVRGPSPASQSVARMSLMRRRASASSIRWDFRRSF